MSPSTPLHPQRIRTMTRLLAALVATTLLGSLVYEWSRWSKPHPWETHPSILPPLTESPWPTLERIHPSALPWTLDPHTTHPQTPCALLDTLRTRYPVWHTPKYPHLLQASTSCQTQRSLPSPSTHILTRDGALLIQRTPRAELVLTHQRGLLVRTPTTPP